MKNQSFSELLIAEIGSVHDGSFGNATKLIEAAAAAGANVVKFQTHIAEAETLPNAPSPAYFKSEPRMDYFRRTGFSLEQWQKLAAHCRENGVQFMSSPFSIEAVDLLEEVGNAIYKIPSGEVNNIPMLERIVETRKPVLLSSGMSNWAELDAAVEVLKKGGPLCVMQCTSMYPCVPERIGLNVLVEMKERFKSQIGYSDHTLGFGAPIAAAALGATVIEKHFTFSKLMYGSDAKHSMEPGEFSILAAALREVWTAMRNPVDKDDLAPFKDMKEIFEKSIVTTRDLSAGTVLRREDLAFKKPGNGIKAFDYKKVLGRELARSLPAQHLLSQGDLK